MSEKEKQGQIPEASDQVKDYLCESLRIWDLQPAERFRSVQFMKHMLEDGGYSSDAVTQAILKGKYGDRAKELYLNYHMLEGEELSKKDRQFYEKHKDLIY